MAGIEPGNILVRVDARDIVPPEHPVFPMGKQTRVEFIDNHDQQRTVEVNVARPKGKKLQFIEPVLVEARQLQDGLGYLKVAMFPGMVGVVVANQISSAVESLGKIDELIIDLRGNTGGGIGALRVMSLLTRESIPVGFALDRRRSKANLEVDKLRFPRFSRIPATTRHLWLLGLKFGPAMMAKKPIVLETEGLGPKTFHGRITLLVDRHTASAAEMIVAFARENKLAAILGEPTAGRLLSATSVKVGKGFRLALIGHGRDRFWKELRLSRIASLGSIGESAGSGVTGNWISQSNAPGVCLPPRPVEHAHRREGNVHQTKRTDQY